MASMGVTDLTGDGVAAPGALLRDDEDVHVAVIGELDRADPGRPTPAGNLGLWHASKRTL